MKKAFVFIAFMAILIVAFSSCSKSSPLPQKTNGQSEEVNLSGDPIKSKNDPPRK